MRRWVFAAAGTAALAGIGVAAARSKGGTDVGLRRSFERAMLGVPHGPLGWIGVRLMARSKGSFYRAMAAELDLQPEDVLLDVGCGSAGLLVEQASHVAYVAGLDVSEMQVEMARRRLADRLAAGTAEIVLGDAAALPWEDGRFQRCRLPRRHEVHPGSRGSTPGDGPGPPPGRPRRCRRERRGEVPRKEHRSVGHARRLGNVALERCRRAADGGGSRPRRRHRLRAPGVLQARGRPGRQALAVHAREISRDGSSRGGRREVTTQLPGDGLRRTRTPERGPGGIYVRESGSPGSPAIVFIHGLGQSGREWRQHMAKLAGFHCLAPDLPGFGRSNHLPMPSNERIADLLAELIETRVPAGRAHVVGISWGALLTLVLMQRHPDRVDRAVADGLPLLWPRGSRPLMLWFATLVAPFLHTRPVLALYRDIVDEADLRVASRLAFWKVWAVSLAHVSAATEAPRPTLLVAGEKEGSVRPGDAALAQLIPHAEAWFAPGLGHCWQRKAPDLHIRMLETWLTGGELPAEMRPEPTSSPAAVDRLRREVSRRGEAARRPGPATGGAARGVSA